MILVDLVILVILLNLVNLVILVLETEFAIICFLLLQTMSGTLLQIENTFEANLKVFPVGCFK